MTEVKIGFKQTEVGAIPEECEVARLGDILSLEYGKGLPANERSKGNYPVFGSNGIVGYHEQFLVKGPGIIVGRKGTIGAVTWVDSDFWPIDTTYFVKIKNENVFLKWLFFKLKQSNLPRLSQSDVVPGLKREIVYHITITLPPLPEQRRIAEVLGTVDSAIQKVGGAIAGTERLKKGLMQRLLTRGIGHERLKFSKEMGSEIPDEWEVKTLISAVGEKNDLIVAGPFGSNLKVEDYRTEGIPIIRLQNIEYGRFVDKDIKYISPEKARELNYHSFVKGDIVLAKLGDPIGKTCIVPEFLKGGIVVADVVRIRVDDQFLDKRYIMYILNSFYVSNQLNRGVIGTTRPRVNLDQVRDLLVPLPPLPEQRRIAEILSAADKKLELERRRKQKLERVKKGLMSELLTGRKRVKI